MLYSVKTSDCSSFAESAACIALQSFVQTAESFLNDWSLTSGLMAGSVSSFLVLLQMVDPHFLLSTCES